MSSSSSSSSSSEDSVELCDRCLEGNGVEQVIVEDGSSEMWCSACVAEQAAEAAARRDGTIEFRLVCKLHYEHLVRVWLDAPYAEYAAMLGDAELPYLQLLVKLLLYEDKHQQVLSALLVHEVAVADADPQLLFVESTVGVRLVATCLSLLAHDYVAATLGPLVQRVCAAPHGFEVDAARLKPNDDAVGNRARLAATAQQLFAAIADSLGACPLDVRMLLASVQSIVETRFEGSGRAAVQGFLFLRLFCPALIAPHQYGLVAAEPSPDARRALVLLSKIVQNDARSAAVAASPVRDLGVPMSRENERAMSEYFAGVTRGRVDELTGDHAAAWSRSPLKAVHSVTVMSELLQRVNLHFGHKLKKGVKVTYFEDLYDLLHSDQPVLEGKFVRLAGGSRDF
jgi:hypothetical protein